MSICRKFWLKARDKSFISKLTAGMRRQKMLRKSRKIKNKHIANVISYGKGNFDVELPEPTDLPIPKGKINNILYISNVTWEKYELIDELNRISNVKVLDVRDFRDDDPEVQSRQICESISDIDSINPDVIIIYLCPLLLHESIIKVARDKWSCPILGMNLDDRIQFHPDMIPSKNDGYKRFSHLFDLNLTSSLLAVEWYKKEGSSAYFMPQGFCRKSKYPVAPSKPPDQYMFSFVGSWKYERQSMVNFLSKNDVHVDVFGKGWVNSNFIEDTASVFRNSRINLGVGQIREGSGISCLKGRDTECPAMGGCYLTEYHWELPSLFDIGKEILCYRNEVDMIEQISYYGKRPELCLKIAQAAFDRAHKEHTWENRFREVFRTLGFAA